MKRIELLLAPMAETRHGQTQSQTHPAVLQAIIYMGYSKDMNYTIFFNLHELTGDQ